MSAVTDKLILEVIKSRYQPFDSHEEFDRGFLAYHSGECCNPHDTESVSALAWDCGVQAARMYAKATAA